MQSSRSIVCHGQANARSCFAGITAPKFSTATMGSSPTWRFYQIPQGFGCAEQVQTVRAIKAVVKR